MNEVQAVEGAPGASGEAAAVGVTPHKLVLKLPFLPQQMYEILLDQWVLFTDPKQRSDCHRLAEVWVDNLDYAAIAAAAIKGGADLHSQWEAAKLQAATQLHNAGFTRGVVDKKNGARMV